MEYARTYAVSALANRVCLQGKNPDKKHDHGVALMGMDTESRPAEPYDGARQSLLNKNYHQTSVNNPATKGAN